MLENNRIGQNRVFPIWWLLAVLLAAAGLIVVSQTAKAHTRIEVGPYVIIIGWLNEPPIVGERNALTVEISEDEEPVVGVESTLDAELIFGPETYRVNLNPTTTPGLYTAEIFPTVRGQYELRLFGSIEDLEIDETAEPEELAPASRIQFPEPLPDGRDLQKEISALENEVQTTRTFAYIALGLAVVAGLVAIASLILKR